MMYNHPKNDLNKFICQIFLNSKKPVGGLCASQDWSQKIHIKKSKCFIKGKFCANIPK